jgi:hypothetical protein
MIPKSLSKTTVYMAWPGNLTRNMDAMEFHRMFIFKMDTIFDT